MPGVEFGVNPQCKEGSCISGIPDTASSFWFPINIKYAAAPGIVYIWSKKEKCCAMAQTHFSSTCQLFNGFLKPLTTTQPFLSLKDINLLELGAMNWTRRPQFCTSWRCTELAEEVHVAAWAPKPPKIKFFKGLEVTALCYSVISVLGLHQL